MYKVIDFKFAYRRGWVYVQKQTGNENLFSVSSQHFTVSFYLLKFEFPFITTIIDSLDIIMKMK